MIRTEQDRGEVRNSKDLHPHLHIFDRLKRLVTSNGSYEKGVAIVESTLTIPIIVMLTFASLDLGRALNSYLALSRVGYEALRFAASTPGLSIGTRCSNTSPCENGLLGVHDRIAQLFTELGIDATTVTVTSEVTALSASEVPLTVVKLSIFAPFKAISVPHANEQDLRIRINVVGPYLMSDS